MLPEDIIYVTTYKSCSRLRKCTEPKACLASLGNPICKVELPTIKQ